MSDNYNSKYNLRLLGSVVSIILLGIISFNYISTKELNILLIVILSATMAITLFVPTLLTPFNILLIKLGNLLGKFLNPIILSIIYLFVMIPTSIFVKLFIRDPMKRKYDKKINSYWIERNKKEFDFDNQF